MDLQGPDFSDARDAIFSDSRDPMAFFNDSRDPIFNSRDPNQLHNKTKKNLLTMSVTPSFRGVTERHCLLKGILSQQRIRH